MPEAAHEPLPDDDGIPERAEAEAPVPARPRRVKRPGRWGLGKLLRLAAPVAIAAWFTHNWWGPRTGLTRLWQRLLVGRGLTEPAVGPALKGDLASPSTIVFSGHKGVVWGVAFHPDGQRVATGCEDGRVGLWPLGGAGGAMLSGHKGWVRSVAFSPDGQRLASASFDGTVRLWDVAERKLVQALQDTRPAFYPVWYPDGRRLATGSDDAAARVWDLATGTVALRLQGHTDRAWAVALSPDGRTLATGSRDGTARLWDSGTGRLQRVLAGHKGVVSTVAFSPDGALLATGSYSDKTVRFWSVVTGQPVGSTVRFPAGLYQIAYSPGGGWLAIAVENGTVILWDPSAGRPLTTLRGGGFSVAFAPEGAWLASGGRDGKTTLWSRHHLMGLCGAGG
jgi:WD40 repeat protein